MNTTFIFGFVIFAIFVCVNFASAGGKGHDVIVLGGHGGGHGGGGHGYGHSGGCGPGLVMKTGKKGKGNIIIMNNCHKKHHYNHHQHYHHHMPEYHHEEYHHDEHGY